VLLVFLVTTQVFAQKNFLTKEGYISFFSHTLVEDIKADNNQVLSVINSETGEIAVQLLMRSFLFKKALMQQHFNESYVESHKYPKATFKGFILNFNELDEVQSNTEVKGTLTMHGKTKEISFSATVHKSGDQIKLSGNFTLEVVDFDIKIPAVVRKNIAKVIEVTFNLNHKPYNP
jgi:polyisoprenoid-binding protein YceI